MIRFKALDSWRGICACLVVLFHFQVNSRVFTLPLVRNSYLFVDFFFVLSGFVITWTYARNLTSWLSIRDFLVLRLGRLYPLHLFVLLCLVALELLHLLFGHADPTVYRAFSSEEHSVQAIVTNLLLIQSLDTHRDLTWNEPSWSISTECWAYVAFALVTFKFGQQRLRVAATVALAVIAAPQAIHLLSSHAMNTTFDYGLIRCLYGFALGCACCHLYRYLLGQGWHRLVDPLAMSVLEAGAVLMALIFVSLADESWASILAPYVFALMVVIFAFEGGAISRALKSPVPQWLGERSYSIYMNHWLVWVAASVTLSFAQNTLLHIKLWGLLNSATGHAVNVIGRNPVEGNVAELVLVALTLTLSAFTYEWIERPGRVWSRCWIARHTTPALPTTPADLPGPNQAAADGSAIGLQSFRHR